MTNEIFNIFDEISLKTNEIKLKMHNIMLHRNQYHQIPCFKKFKRIGLKPK